MSDGLAIRLLGEVTITRNGAPIAELTIRTDLALLAFLVCTRQPQPREVLSDLFWETCTPRQAQSNLRTVLTRLRIGLAPHLVITRQTVAWDPHSPYWLDVAEFQAQIKAVPADGRDLDRAAVAQLTQALRLYRGIFWPASPCEPRRALKSGPRWNGSACTCSPLAGCTGWSGITWTGASTTKGSHTRPGCWRWTPWTNPLIAR